MKTMSFPRWTKEEIGIVLEMRGYPIQVVLRRINDWHRQTNSETRRSVDSVASQIRKLKIGKLTGTTSSWSEKEIEYLTENCGYYPVKILTQKINRWHRRHGTGIKRSSTAVKVKLTKLGYSATPKDDNMTASEWARQLGFGRYKVREWVRHRGLIAKEIARNKLCISVEEMKAFAKEKPHLFSSANQEYLLYYFGEELTQAILDAKEKSYEVVSRKKPIKRKDTGEVYTSIFEASKQLKMDKNAVRREAQRGGWLQFV